MERPWLIVAADWSKDWAGRWLIEAVREGAGYIISHPCPVGPPEHLVESLLNKLPPGRSALLGLDFPLGLPRLYASYRGIRSFRQWLTKLGDQEWEMLSEVTDRPSIAQPFGPKSSRKGVLTKRQLADALGLTESGLYRTCELRAPGRPESLFFTCGASQVGRAALQGWGSVIRPNLKRIKLWPFDGKLTDLLREPGLVVAEIYPQVARRLLSIPRSTPTPNGRARKGKNSPEYRLSSSVQRPLLQSAAEVGANFSPSAETWINTGFAGSHDFDALVSLLGILKTTNDLLSHDGGPRQGYPVGFVRSVEGWILGLDAVPVSYTAPPSTVDLEEHVCCSVIGFLAERSEAIPGIIRRPDSDERQEQAVDRSFVLRSRRYVLEHTRIEAYEGRIRDDVVAARLLAGLGDALGDFSLPDSRLSLMLPSRVHLSERRIREVAPILADWIKVAAPALVLGSPRSSPRHFRKEALSELGFEVGLYRFANTEYELVISGPAPEGDALLLQRISRAFDRKLSKFEHAKARHSASSVLVLEHRDPQLGDAFSIAGALRSILETAVAPKPDTIFLFESDAWSIWLLREEGVWIDLDNLQASDAP